MNNYNTDLRYFTTCGRATSELTECDVEIAKLAYDISVYKPKVYTLLIS